MHVYYNGVEMCTEPRADRTAFRDVKVYASDPWYPASDATIDNFYLLSPDTSDTGAFHTFRFNMVGDGDDTGVRGPGANSVQMSEIALYDRQVRGNGHV